MYSVKVVPGLDIATGQQYNRLRTDAQASGYLLTHAENTPDNTFKVESGFWYNDTTRVDVSLFTSPAVVAPTISNRIDLVTCSPAWVVTITAGSEWGSTPTVPTGHFIISEIFCRVGGTVVQDEDDTVNHYIIDRRQSLNLWGGGWSGTWTLHVDLIFNDHLNDLPATTAVKIDWVTVTTGVLVYVQDCSDAWKIWNTYLASVVGVNITWAFSATVLPWTWIYATYGDTYGSNVIISGDTITNLWDVIVNNINISSGTAVLTGSWNEVQFTNVTTTVTLPSLPVSQYGVFVNLPPVLKGTDYSVDELTGIITFSPSLDGADISVKYMVASTVTINAGTGFKILSGLWDVSVDPIERVIPDFEIKATSNYMIQFTGTQPSGQIDGSVIDGVLTLNSSVNEPVDLNYKIVLFTDNPITATSVRPSNLNATNSPVDGYIQVKWVWVDQFTWQQFPAMPMKKVTSVARTWPATSLPVTDADCTTDSVIMGWTITAGTQVWFWQFTVWAGSFTINSTASESGLTFNYVIYK